MKIAKPDEAKLAIFVKQKQDKICVRCCKKWV